MEERTKVVLISGLIRINAILSSQLPFPSTDASVEVLWHVHGSFHFVDRPDCILALFNNIVWRECSSEVLVNLLMRQSLLPCPAVCALFPARLQQIDHSREEREHCHLYTSHRMTANKSANKSNSFASLSSQLERIISGN